MIDFPGKFLDLGGEFLPVGVLNKSHILIIAYTIIFQEFQ